MRFYGFSADELTTSTDRNLPLDRDPKLAWAFRHREFFPVDVNKAGRAALLRVPGFGVRNVKRILKIRRYRALTLSDLAKLKISVKKAQYSSSPRTTIPPPTSIDSPHLAAACSTCPASNSVFSRPLKPRARASYDRGRARRF